MLGLLKSIFGNDSRTNKIIDAVINGGDALILTEQEKKEFNVKKSEVFLEFVKATSGSNVARRFIAIGIAFVWGCYTLSYLGIALAHLFVNDFERLDKSLSHLTEGYSWVSVAFMAILAFYYGKGLAENHQNNKNK